MAFDDPDYVKIVWSLRAERLGDNESMFRTETRAVATDDVARMTFRRYWALVSPGVALIRRMSLRPLKAEAERRARTSAKPTSTAPPARQPRAVHADDLTTRVVRAAR